MTQATQEITRRPEAEAPAPTPEAEPVAMGPVFSPATDITETDEAIRVVSDLPGVEEKDLQITLENRVLSLEARQRSQAPEGLDPLVEGYLTGTFRRTFRINAPVDEKGIKARLSRGVLELTLPKAEEARPRRIQVEAG